jgi:hypothetical protein
MVTTGRYERFIWILSPVIQPVCFDGVSLTKQVYVLYAKYMFIKRTSTSAVYLLHNGKLVLMHPSAWQAQKVPVISVDESTWANLTLAGAFGTPVGT